MPETREGITVGDAAKESIEEDTEVNRTQPLGPITDIEGAVIKAVGTFEPYRNYFDPFKELTS